MKKLSIREYLDYRVFLKDAYAVLHKKNKAFNYKYLIEKLGLKSQGHITSVLNGKRNIPPASVELFANLFGLKRTDKDYFCNLVAYNQAKRHEQKDAAFKKLVAFHRKKQFINPDIYRYFSHWYNPVIRELIALIPVTDNSVGELSRYLKPKIAPSQVKEALELLESLKLVTKDPAGQYQRVDTVISTGEGWRSLIIHKYQRAAMERAREALDTIDKELRDISTITISCAHTRLNEMKEKIKKFREELLAMAAADTEANQVFQCNIQLFPISEKVDD